MEKTANARYKRYLSGIKQTLGNGTTNSDELTKLGKRLFGKKYKGTFSADTIPKMENETYAIVNLDKSSKGGSHWIALVKRKDEIVVYDSFGRRTVQILPSLLQSGNGIIIETENDAEQKKHEQDCGSRCLASLMVYKTLGRGALMHI
jgi:hypothetical protein